MGNLYHIQGVILLCFDLVLSVASGQLFSNASPESVFLFKTLYGEMVKYKMFVILVYFLATVFLQITVLRTSSLMGLSSTSFVRSVQLRFLF